MSVYELFDIATATANRADLQWGLFITIHMALFGGIVYVDRPLKRTEKAATLVIYFGFAAINYLLTRSLLEFVHLANLEIAKFATDPCCVDNLLVESIVERVEGPAFDIGGNILIVSHGVMAVLVMLAVVFDKSLTDFVKKPAS
ncbi:MAG: hypothetical protein AAGF72_01020 [Pseudomonadota bacterium]